MNKICIGCNKEFNGRTRDKNFEEVQKILNQSIIGV